MEAIIIPFTDTWSMELPTMNAGTVRNVSNANFLAGGYYIIC